MGVPRLSPKERRMQSLLFVASFSAAGGSLVTGLAFFTQPGMREDLYQAWIRFVWDFIDFDVFSLWVYSLTPLACIVYGCSFFAMIWATLAFRARKASDVTLIGLGGFHVAAFLVLLLWNHITFAHSWDVINSAGRPFYDSVLGTHILIGIGFLMHLGVVLVSMAPLAADLRRFIRLNKSSLFVALLCLGNVALDWQFGILYSKMVW